MYVPLKKKPASLKDSGEDNFPTGQFLKEFSLESSRSYDGYFGRSQYFIARFMAWCSDNGCNGECPLSSLGPISAERVLVPESLISPVMKRPVRSGLELGLYSMLSSFQNAVRKHASATFI